MAKKQKAIYDRAKTVSGSNQFNEKDFRKMCEVLESGEAIAIYIDCIGHTRHHIESSHYANELKKVYGDKLIVDDSHYTIYCELKK